MAPRYVRLEDIAEPPTRDVLKAVGNTMLKFVWEVWEKKTRAKGSKLPLKIPPQLGAVEWSWGLQLWESREAEFVHMLETMKHTLKDQVYEPKSPYGNFVNQNVWEPRLQTGIWWDSMYILPWRPCLFADQSQVSQFNVIGEITLKYQWSINSCILA